MAVVNWTTQALDDLDSICEFIARDAMRYAQLFAIQAFETVDRLEMFPLSGRVVPEINKQEIREVILGNYRIVYRFMGNEVEVLTVHHGAQLLTADKLKI
ncbi:MAG: plasmid stabilization protein [Nitrospirae bacterium GWF2_44_13]|nr:MAG: plasmid stabilization protein [Nitrospirae bacterium GWF2_44_13]OGW32458.1 MAG: plasmid stabilization protein [Nitrospirae bacterium GWD2_44_7]OGW65865.1 MAG: plasmid stabilization protein [Nitrospirae bacterium RIFOXYA2_FULL_44_9]OGW73030.1 MAG: plasmid stabilization protein [Nitrospirae bacterium RIFOXYC2_FULL_44_7]HBG93274.1 type II toxin-antitoxin system RelE/ParE family toxin [Nitrospiraceae bacterium]